MTWDETKQTLNDRPDIVSERKLTSADWNDMVTDQKDHATRHEDGGVDELNVTGLSGLLADPQTPNTEDVQDIVGAFTQAATGSNISVSYDDVNDTLTIDTTALNPEETRDTVNDLLVGGTNTALTYDDVNDTLTIDVDAPTTAEFNDHSTRHESGGTDEIPLNNLDLPAGAQIDEDGGDLVVRDSGGAIVLRRDETAGTWDFVSGDLTGIASLEANSVTVSEDGVGRTVDLVAYDVDNDGTTDLNLSVSLDTSYDRYLVEVQTFDGQNSNALLFLTVANNTNASYSYDEITASGSLAQTTGASRLKLGETQQGSDIQAQTWYLTLPIDGAKTPINVNAESLVSEGEATLRGSLNESQTPDSLQVFTDANEGRAGYIVAMGVIVE